MIQIYRQEIGSMWYAVAMENGKVIATAFSPNERDALSFIFDHLPYDEPFEVAEEPTSFSMYLLKTLETIWDGKEVSSKFEMTMNFLPQYSRKVLQCTSLIPIGYLTNYGAISKIVGGSPRAVGRALALNPFPLLIPCHRVVRSDFSIGGYGLGEEVMLELLRREDRGYKEPARLEIKDKALSLFPIAYLKI